MMKKGIAVAALSAAALLSGCVTSSQMAFQDDSQRLTEKSKPVLLMTVTIKNALRPPFRPRLLVVNVEKPQAKEAADRLVFRMDDKGTMETNSAAGNSYLVRLELDPGQYEIRGMTALASVFPINSFFVVPMHSPLQVKGPGVYYLGHVDATVRGRQGEEFQAGPAFPLIDQAISGASTGTFDVEITDRFAVDEGTFREKFPTLAGVKIENVVLPPFDRAKAQQLWEQK